MYALLSDDERQRAAHFYFDRDRNRYIVAHGVLRQILSRYVGRAPEALKFRLATYGKPELDVPECRISFNMAHSGNVAIYAVGLDRAVGVDIERVSDDKDLMALPQHYFSKREFRDLLALPPEGRRDAFFRCWTRKEAFVKARGDGLSLPLDRFDVTLGPTELARITATRPDASEAARWHLHELQGPPGYMAALVAGGARVRVRYRMDDAAQSG